LEITVVSILTTAVCDTDGITIGSTYGALCRPKASIEFSTAIDTPWNCPWRRRGELFNDSAVCFPFMYADSGSRQIFTGTQIGTGNRRTMWCWLNFVRMLSPRPTCAYVQGVHARLQAGTDDTKWKYEVQIACHQAEENSDTSDTWTLNLLN
jgi:hypothetical protein